MEKWAQGHPKHTEKTEGAGTSRDDATIGAKKIDVYKNKVGRKQNIITFFLLEIGLKFKQVWIGHGKGFLEIQPVKAYTPDFYNFILPKKIVTFSKFFFL